MTPDEFRNAFIKSRGLNLTSNPIPIPPPTPVQTVPITPTDPTQPPVRTNPDGSLVGNMTSNKIDNPTAWNPASVPPMPLAAAPPPPAPFPTQGAPAVPYSRPAVEQAPGGGLSLASNPVQDWRGSVGVGDGAAPAADTNKTLEGGLSAIADIVKASAQKPKQDSQMNALTPMSVQPNTNSPLAADLLTSLMKRNRNLRV